MLAELVYLETQFVAIWLRNDLPGQIDPQPVTWRRLGLPEKIIYNFSIQNNR